jgi:replicative DNA helicase Mcm
MSGTNADSTQRPTTRIDVLVQFYRNWCHEDIARFAQRYPNDEAVFEISYADLRNACPDIADDYLKKPGEIKADLEEALRMVELPVDIDLSGAQVRIVDVEDAAPELTWTLGEYLPEEVSNDFIFVQGQVTKASEPVLRPTKTIYECQRCGTQTPLAVAPFQPLPEPHECSGCERQGPFVPLTDKMAESAVNHQLIRLERPPEQAQQAGEDTLEIVLEDDLVRSCKPGDRVTVATEMETLIDDGGTTPTLEFRGVADTVELNETDFTQVDYSDHIDEIEEIANSVDPFEQIVNSILPSHEGHRTIKLALFLQLVGGVEKDHADGSTTRGSIHVFLVGDPGVGKTSLMSYINEITPRSVYTTGTGSTAAGLTCAAVQDDFGDSGWTLESGALVEAHNGVALIDELDDMSDEDQAGLLECMDQQQTSVSKAGMNITMPANTTVLTAANPVFGRFDPYEPLGEQLDIHAALFSRFDLIYPMRDEPDEEFDRDVAGTITDTQQSGQLREAGQDPGQAPDQPAILPEVLRSYVAYAREITPVLTDDAKDRIAREYVNIRMSNDEDGPIPTTTRLLNTLVRLSEASARVRLDQRVTVKDVNRALELYMDYITSLGLDPETDELDADIIETGTSKSQRERIKAVKKVIAALEMEYDSGAPHEAVVDHVELDDWDRSKIEHELDNLLNKGEIYEPRDEHYMTT